MPTLRFSLFINVHNSSANRRSFLAQKSVLDDFVGVHGPISVSVQESETRQPL